MISIQKQIYSILATKLKENGVNIVSNTLDLDETNNAILQFVNTVYERKPRVNASICTTEYQIEIKTNATSQNLDDVYDKLEQQVSSLESCIFEIEKYARGQIPTIEQLSITNASYNIDDNGSVLLASVTITIQAKYAKVS